MSHEKFYERKTSRRFKYATHQAQKISPQNGKILSCRSVDPINFTWFAFGGIFHRETRRKVSTPSHVELISLTSFWNAMDGRHMVREVGVAGVHGPGLGMVLDWEWSHQHVLYDISQHYM